MFIRNRSTGDAPALEAIALETHRLDGYPKYLPGDLRSFLVDADALGAWVAESNAHAIGDEVLGREVRGREVRGREVLGHVALHRSSAQQVMDVALSATGLDEESIAVVARLLVAPSARRQGIGRALLEKATREAALLGRRAVLDVVEDHTSAIALYEDCGWTSVGKVDWMLPGGLPLREFIYVSPEPCA